MSTKVQYKGTQIAELSAQQTKTLLTAGKFCEGDITLIDDSNPIAEENDVIFIDYDGTIRYSYSADEFLALTELPPNPVHEGLTGDGWNWSLTDAKTLVQKTNMAIIGSLYKPTDGRTHFFFDLPEGFTKVTVSLGLNGTAIVDYMDGSALDEVTGNRLSTIFSSSHVYASHGKKEIAIKINGEASFAQRGNIGSTIACGYETKSTPYQVESIFVGDNFFFDTNYGLAENYNLKEIVIPKNAIRRTATGCFIGCVGLKAIVIPQGSYSISGGYYVDCQYISMPKDYASIDDWTNNIPANLRKIILSNAQNALPKLKEPRSLVCMVIPEPVSTISNNSYTALQNITAIRFCPIIPPTLAGSSAFKDLNPALILYVPYSAMAAYLTGTNYPSPVTYTYVGFATYTSGATLPTQDGTEAYNVTWYANKADAISETNPITVGNGKEIYCRYTAV